MAQEAGIANIACVCFLLGLVPKPTCEWKDCQKGIADTKKFMELLAAGAGFGGVVGHLLAGRLGRLQQLLQRPERREGVGT